MQVTELPTLLRTLALLSLGTMLFGIPFIRFNYKEPPKKKNPAYESIQMYLPNLTEEDIIRLKQ